jgi:RND family efflux transporter, MFP subunit
MKISRNNVFKFAALGAAACAAIAGCKKEAAQDGAGATAAAKPTIADRIINVKVTQAGREAFERRFAVTGSLSSEDFAAVAARVAGNVDGVFADIGDRVEGGVTKLFQIDPVELRERVTIAELAVSTAEASLAVAEAGRVRAAAERDKAALDAERYTRLREQEKVSANEFEQVMTQKTALEAAVAIADANINLSKQQIEQCKASLAIARRNLADATGVAPISGTVSERLKEPGERVGVGDVILRVNNLDKIRAAAFLPAEFYDDVVAGETEFRLEVNGNDLGSHKVSVKSPVIDKRLRVFEFRGLLEGVSGAVPGASAKFAVVFDRHDGVSVPDEAVLLRSSGHVVFVAEGGAAREVVVKTGLRNEGRTEILEGLAGGEMVVVEGQSQLYDGRKIAVANGAQ